MDFVADLCHGKYGTIAAIVTILELADLTRCREVVLKPLADWTRLSLDPAHARAIAVQLRHIRHRLKRLSVGEGAFGDGRHGAEEGGEGTG